MKRGRSDIDQSFYPMFVTTTITDFVPVFANPIIASHALHIFEEQRRLLCVDVYAYVLMPTHIHCIIRAKRTNGTSEFIGAWKSLSARMILEHATAEWKETFSLAARVYCEPMRKQHKVWMTRFDDVALYSDDVYATKLNYINENPVRDGLVERAEEYPFSSYRSSVTGRTDEFVTLTDILNGVKRPVRREDVGSAVNVPLGPWADRAFGRGSSGQPKG